MGVTYRARPVVALAAAAISLAGAPRTAPAQQPARARALVDYIAGANLYLRAGTEIGVLAGDTIMGSRVGGERESALRVVASAEGRAVITFAGTPFAITRGDTLLLWGFRAPEAGASTRRPTDRSTASAAPPRGDAGRTLPRRGAVARTPARLDGTISFDVDMLDSRIEWSDDPSDRVERRFVSPAVRLYATLSDLPGGFSAQSNMRYEYRRTDDGTTIGTNDALRIYQASVSKTFDRLPLSFEIGRFFNPVDLYGGYWDGAMIRVGRSAGIGVSAGFEPDRVNGRFDGTARKLSIFADYAVRGRKATYNLGLSAHDDAAQAPDGGRYVSLVQRLRFGRAWVQQRLRMSTDSTWDGWSLAQLDINATTPLVGSLYARGYWTRRVYDWMDANADSIIPRNERRGGGVLLSDSRLSVSADASHAQWSDGTSSMIYSGALSVPGLVAGFGLGASGSLRMEDEIDSWYVSPWLTRAFGRTSMTAAYRRYDTPGAGGDDYQAIGLSVSSPLPGRTYASIQSQFQFGTSTSQRLWFSLGKSF